MEATKTMATRQAEIDRLKALTGRTFTEREDGWLEYAGDLHLGDANIMDLPRDLHIGGDLDLRGARIQRISGGLYVGGTLYGSIILD